MKVVSSPDEVFVSDKRLESLRTELTNFAKLLKNNGKALCGLVELRSRCGATIDPICCRPVSKETMTAIGMRAVMCLLNGLEEEGHYDSWKVGCFGSRWFDMDPEPFGVDHIRVAFYSKKTYEDEWKSEKPYLLAITVEKAR